MGCSKVDVTAHIGIVGRMLARWLGMYIVGSIHFLHTSYADKIRTRMIYDTFTMVNFVSLAFISRHNLPAASSVSLALKTLINREFIYKYNGSFIICHIHIFTD